MSKKETTNPKEVRNQNYEDNKMNTYEDSMKKKNIIIDFLSFLIKSLDIFLAFNIFISNLSGSPI